MATAALYVQLPIIWSDFSRGDKGGVECATAAAAVAICAGWLTACSNGCRLKYRLCGEDALLRA